MTLSLRGIALGATMFTFCLIALLMITVWQVQHVAPGGSVDLVSLVQHARFASPIFVGLLLIAMVIFGCLITTSSQKRQQPSGR